MYFIAFGMLSLYSYESIFKLDGVT